MIHTEQQTILRHSFDLRITFTISFQMNVTKVSQFYFCNLWEFIVLSPYFLWRSV